MERLDITLQEVRTNVDIHLIQSLDELYSHNDGKECRLDSCAEHSQTPSTRRAIRLRRPPLKGPADRRTLHQNIFIERWREGTESQFTHFYLQKSFLPLAKNLNVVFTDLSEQRLFTSVRARCFSNQRTLLELFNQRRLRTLLEHTRDIRLILGKSSSFLSRSMTAPTLRSFRWAVTWHSSSKTPALSTSWWSHNDILLE